MMKNSPQTVPGLDSVSDPEPLRRSSRIRGSTISYTNRGGSSGSGSGSATGGSRSGRGGFISSLRGVSILRGRGGSNSNRGNRKTDKKV